MKAIPSNEPEVDVNNKVFRSVSAGLGIDYPIIVQQGGTYSGKTYNILLALLFFAKNNPFNLLISVVSCTVPHLKRGALRDFEDILLKTGTPYKWNKSDNIFSVGRCKIEFFSADDDGKVRGGKRDILFVNECNLINFERYQQLALRTRKTVILDYNPVSEFWIHEHILTRTTKEVLFKRTTYRDNPRVPDKVVREIEALKDVDEQLYRVYALGLTGVIQGLIFPNVEYIDTFPGNARKRAFGLDWGYSNDPTTLIEFGQISEGSCFDEWLFETGLTNEMIHERFLALGVRKTDEIIADSAEPKSIDYLKDKGWNIWPAVKGADSVKFGIDTIKKSKIFITKRSVNFAKEQRNYRWKIDSNGKILNIPIDAFNHCWDAARYVATWKLTGSRLPEMM